MGPSTNLYVVGRYGRAAASMFGPQARWPSDAPLLQRWPRQIRSTVTSLTPSSSAIARKVIPASRRVVMRSF